LAQNRIDYIVYHDPEGVKKLIYESGYHPPKDEKELVQATKELMKMDGGDFIKKLLELHPEKVLIESLKGKSNNGKSKGNCPNCGKPSEEEDSYCGCGTSNYDGGEYYFDKETYLSDLKDMSLAQIKEHYEAIRAESNQNPTDSTLAEEVQYVWNYLKEKKEVPSKSSKESELGLSKVEGVLIGGLLLITGILVGSAMARTPAPISY